MVAPPEKEAERMKRIGSIYLQAAIAGISAGPGGNGTATFVDTPIN
jgi:hypothetical protein